MENKNDQKKQFIMFGSLTTAYCGMFVGGLRFGLEIAEIVVGDSVFGMETVARLVIYLCTILSAVFLVRFLKNVDKGFVFDRKNIYPLRYFGWTVTLTGVALVVLHAMADSDNQTYMFFLLIGIFINIVSEVFSLGVSMKEEQELTI